jgi:hypothetical protein
MGLLASKPRKAPIEIHRPFHVNGFEDEIEAIVSAIREGSIGCDRVPH